MKKKVIIFARSNTVAGGEVLSDIYRHWYYTIYTRYYRASHQHLYHIMTFRDLVWRLRGMGINLSLVGRWRVMPGWVWNIFPSSNNKISPLTCYCNPICVYRVTDRCPPSGLHVPHIRLPADRAPPHGGDQDQARHLHPAGGGAGGEGGVGRQPGVQDRVRY